MVKLTKPKWYRNYLWLILPIIHFALSFWYERKIFKYDATSWDIFWSVSLDDSISNRTQSVLLYAYGKVVAGILIFLIWFTLYKVVVNVVKRKFPKHILGMFAFILVVLGAYYLLFWPSSFNWPDSYTIYGFALRFIPWYWHHFLTSAWYVGCLMVFPHPIILSVIQFVGFAAVILYLYYRIEKSFSPKIWAKMLILLIYVAPETFMLVTQVYRNCIYAIILMFYLTFLVLEDVDRAESTIWKMILICGLSALLSVWRTEGILVGIVGIILSITKIYKITTLKKILVLLGFGITFVVLNAPQKIGNAKYYGKDYIIVSTIEPVKNILNDENVNISYEGADEDLKSIEAYAPVQIICYDGINGVRGFFYGPGHTDFNQSLAGKDIQDAYLKGFARLALHNMRPYILSQMNFMFDALEIDFNFKMGEYNDFNTESDLEYKIYKIGENDYLYAQGVQELLENEIYLKLGGYVGAITIKFRDFIKKTHITAILRVLILLFDFAIFVIELIKLIRKKKGNVTYMLFALMFLIQFGIVTMTIPSWYSLYYYAIFYPCFVLIIIYAFSQVQKLCKNDDAAEEE